MARPFPQRSPGCSVLFQGLLTLSAVCLHAVLLEAKGERPQEVQERHTLPPAWKEMSLASSGIREEEGAASVPSYVRQSRGDRRHSIQSKKFLEGW